MSNIKKQIIGIVIALTSAVMIAGPAAQAATVEELLAQINQLQAQLLALQAQLGQTQGQSSGACTGIAFTRNLALGSSGSDVKCMQSLLNSDADTKIAASGVGSPGYETTYFGNLTKAAVIKFQNKYASAILTPVGLTAGTGFVGAKTLAKLTAMIGGYVGPVTTGSPAASLAADTPVAATMPYNSAKVPVLKVALSAGTNAVTITSLTFKRTGVGSQNDWSALYLYIDDLRVTTYGRTISSDTQLVEFPALNIAIPAGQYKNVTLRADVAASGTANAGNQSAFQLTASNVSFSGLPVTGKLMTIGGVGVSTTTVSTGSTIVSPVVGSQGADIGSFKITAGNQDVDLKQVILTISGTIARANVTNIKLYYESTLLATAAGVDTYDNAVLTLATPYTVAKTLVRTFIIKADLGGRVGETLTTKIQEAGDVLVIDKVYGYGSVISGTFPVSGTALILKGGTLTLADQGPLAGKVSKNTQDVVLTKIGLTASRNLELLKFRVTMRTTATSTGITDLRIKDADTGATLMQKDATTYASVTSSTTTLSGSIILTANSTKNLAITVDIASTALTSAKLSADLEVEPYSTTQSYVRDSVTGDYVATAEIVPAKVTGDDQEIVAVSLDLYLNSTPISDTVVTGRTNVPVVGLMFSAGAGTDVTLRGIEAKFYANSSTLQIATSSKTTRDKIVVAKLYDGATLLSQKTLTEYGTENTDAYGWAKFDGINVTVTKNSGKLLTINLDTGTNLASVYYVTVAVATSTVDARDPDNNSVSVGGTGANIVTPGTAPSRYITINTKGTLTLAKNTSETPISANLPVGGAADGKNGVSLLAIDLTATNEDVKITELTLERAGTATSTDDKAYKVAYLYESGGLIGATTFPAGATTTQFKNLSVIAAKDVKKTLYIKADLAGIDGTYVISGSSTLAQISTSTIKAVGVSSGQTIDTAGSVATGASQFLYKTGVEVALSSDSPSGSSIKGGAQDVLHLNITNVGSYDAFFRNATFTIGYNKGTGGNTTTSAARGCAIYDSVDLSTALYSSASCVAAATDLTTGTVTFAATSSTALLTIGPGATKKVILKFDTSDVGSLGGAAFRFDIVSVGNFMWKDSYVDVTARTKNLPIIGGTLIY